MGDVTYCKNRRFVEMQVKVFIGLMRRAGIEVEVLWDGPLVPKFKEEVLRKRNEEVSYYHSR